MSRKNTSTAIETIQTIISRRNKSFQKLFDDLPEKSTTRAICVGTQVTLHLAGERGIKSIL